jgi:hypothetical protein
MDSRRLRWLVLGFACLWFGVLVPIHQRGQIKLPGPRLSERTDAASVSAHCARMAEAVPACHIKRHHAAEPSVPGQTKPDTDGGGDASPDDCAVCHYVLGLYVVPPVTFDFAPLGLLRERAPEEPAALSLHHAALPFHGLDPPLA